MDRVGKISGLVDSGIPTRIVADILPCLNKPQTILVNDPDPELREILMRERDRMSLKIDFLIQNRDAITRYIDALDHATSTRQESQAS